MPRGGGHAEVRLTPLGLTLRGDVISRDERRVPLAHRMAIIFFFLLRWIFIAELYRNVFVS